VKASEWDYIQIYAYWTTKDEESGGYDVGKYCGTLYLVA